MQSFPHEYRVSANGQPTGTVDVIAEGLEAIPTAPPAEFGGPGDRWSPEVLFVAAVADCFILTFRAVARASALEWTSLNCEVTGTLDRVQRVTRFTRVDIRAALGVPGGTDEAKAARALEKAEAGCLITNSLSADVGLEFTVDHDA